MSHNRFDYFPSCSFPSELEEVDFSHNQLEAITAIQLFSKEAFPAMRIVLLSDNNLTRGMPTDFCPPIGLAVLEAANNQLTSLQLSGFESDDCWPEYDAHGIEMQLRLTCFALSGTRAHLPLFVLAILVCGVSALASLDFHGNRQMAGTLPHAFHKLDALTLLDMSGCAITGTIPEFVSDTVHGGDVGPVEYLDLSDNQLSGTLPSGIGSLSASLTCVFQDCKHI